MRERQVMLCLKLNPLEELAKKLYLATPAK